jgi:hypothetical protein
MHYCVALQEIKLSSIARRVPEGCFRFSHGYLTPADLSNCMSSSVVKRYTWGGHSKRDEYTAVLFDDQV